MTLVMRDEHGDEWECEVVGIGTRDDVPPGGTMLGEDFVLLVCWQRGAETIGFRHLRAATSVDLSSPDAQRWLLSESNAWHRSPAASAAGSFSAIPSDQKIGRVLKSDHGGIYRNSASRISRHPDATSIPNP